MRYLEPAAQPLWFDNTATDAGWFDQGLTPSTPQAFVHLDGSTSGDLRVPDSPALQITGDIEIVVRMSFDNTPGTGFRLVSKGYGSKYCVYIHTSGTVWTELGVGGSSIYNGGFILTQTGFATRWIKVTRSASTGVIACYDAADQVLEPTSWTSLGTITATSGALNTDTQQLTIGSGQGNEVTTGNVYRTIIRNGIGGPLVLDVDTEALVSTSQTSFLAVTGQTVSLNGTAQVILNAGAYAHLDGTSNCDLRVADSGALQITGDVEMVARLRVNTMYDYGRVIAHNYSSSYSMALNGYPGGGSHPNGRLSFEFNVSGVGYQYASNSSSDLPTVGTTYWVKVTRSASTGLVSYYKAADQTYEPTSWTAIGTDTTTAGALVATAGVGGLTIGSGNGSEAMNIDVFRAIVRSGIGGTTVLDVDTQGLVSPVQTSFTARTGQLVSLNGSATPTFPSGRTAAVFAFLSAGLAVVAGTSKAGASKAFASASSAARTAISKTVAAAAAVPATGNVRGTAAKVAVSAALVPGPGTMRAGTVKAGTSSAVAPVAASARSNVAKVGSTRANLPASSITRSAVSKLGTVQVFAPAGAMLRSIGAKTNGALASLPAGGAARAVTAKVSAARATMPASSSVRVATAKVVATNALAGAGATAQVFATAARSASVAALIPVGVVLRAAAAKATAAATGRAPAAAGAVSVTSKSVPKVAFVATAATDRGQTAKGSATAGRVPASGGAFGRAAKTSAANVFVAAGAVARGVTVKTSPVKAFAVAGATAQAAAVAARTAAATALIPVGVVLRAATVKAVAAAGTVGVPGTARVNGRKAGNGLAVASAAVTGGARTVKVSAVRTFVSASATASGRGSKTVGRLARAVTGSTFWARVVAAITPAHVPICAHITFTDRWDPLVPHLTDAATVLVGVSDTWVGSMHIEEC